MNHKIIRTAAAVLLFATVATPVFAKNDDKKGEDKKGIGQIVRQLVKARNEEQKNGESDKAEKLRGIGRFVRNSKIDASCLKDAAEAHEDALEAARDARDAALQSARRTRDVAVENADFAYRQAIRTANATRRSVMSAANTTFLASDRGTAAQAAYDAAKTKATTDWKAAKLAAQNIQKAAKSAAEAALKTAKNSVAPAFDAAKQKADADFKIAKDACLAVPVVIVPPVVPATTDTIAPAAVTNLSFSAATGDALTLTWTAAGDDLNVGTAASYDIRYATTDILTAVDFAAATQVANEPAPTIAGTTQSLTVPGLQSHTVYYFAMKVLDEVLNASPVSNVAHLSTN